MKNFNVQAWNETLAKQKWENIGKTEDVAEMANILSSLVNEALDECAPIKKVTIKPNYRQGLTAEAKALMADRNVLKE